MDLLRIAWRNVGRNPRRSVLSALAVGFAVGVLVFAMALQKGSYADMIHNVVHARTGNIQVQHPAYWPDMDLARRLAEPGEILAVVDALPGVRAAAPRVQAAALVSAGERTFGALIQGVDPAREAALSTLAGVVRVGSFLEADDPDGVVVGEILARNLDVQPGDELVFMGQGADGSIAAAALRVRGLFKTGMAELDRTMVAAHIDTVGEAFSMQGAVTEVAMLLDSDRRRPAAAAALAARLAEAGRGEDAAVVEWPTLMPGVEESIRLDWYSGQIIYLVLVLVVGFGIANTFLMAYLERIHEFGVLLAVGMRPGRLARMVYAESVLLSLAGIAVGLVFGVSGVLLTRRTGISFGEGTEELMAEYGMSPRIHPMLTPSVLGYAVAIVLAVACLLALYPAVKAARLTPVEALRHR